MTSTLWTQRKRKYKLGTRTNKCKAFGFSAWGIQTGPLASPKTNLILKIFYLLHLYTGWPILITPVPVG